MNDALHLLQNSFGEQRVKCNEPMGKHVGVGVGGNAEYYLELDRIEELANIVKICAENNIPLYIIGTGSNTIIADDGIRGLVVKNNSRKFDILSRKGKIRNNKINIDRAYVYADSGVLINQLVRFAIEQNLSGLENLLGTQGTVGGLLHRTSEEVKDIEEYIYQINALNENGIEQLIDRNVLTGGDSRNKKSKSDYFVLSALFELFPLDKNILWERGEQAIKNREKNKPEEKQVIKIFREISTADAMSIPTPGYTTSPAYLIEKAGLKVRSIGDVIISDQNANYVINGGNAKADELIELIELVKKSVYASFKVQLVPEVTIIKE